jgi:hypothetical protein
MTAPITANVIAILHPVKRYGVAIGTRSRRKIAQSDARRNTSNPTLPWGWLQKRRPPRRCSKLVRTDSAFSAIPLIQRAVPITPANRTGAFVDYFPVHTAFPAFWPGRHPHYGFRGLLRLHSRYGPLDCSTARSGLCHEASARSVARPSRSSATRSIDNSLGGTLLRW